MPARRQAETVPVGGSELGDGPRPAAGGAGPGAA